MLCGETVAVCCENRTEHTDTLWAVRTSQETYHVSTTEPNRLMLCGETVAVCCENRTERTDTLCGQSVPHRRHTNTLCGQNAEFPNVKGSGIDIYHCAFKDNDGEVVF
jgi:hypothetical protein